VNKIAAYVLIVALIVNMFSGLMLTAESVNATSANSKVLELKFEDNITDSSESGTIGTWSGAEVTYVEGKVGKAIHLNGSNNYIDLGTSSALQPENLTFTAWVKPDAAITGEHIIAWFKPSGEYNGNGWYLSLLSDTVPLTLSTGTAPQEAYVEGSRSSFFPVGEWTHIAVTYDNATGAAAIYRNGVAQQVKYNTTTKSGIIANGSDHKYLGFNSPGYGFGHAGINLDELKLFSEAASSTDIQSVYLE
jgi:hypothetical protein